MKVSGQKVKNLRESQDVTREELAQSIKKTAAYIGKIERGKSQPTVPVALGIAKKLGVELEELLEELLEE